MLPAWPHSCLGQSPTRQCPSTAPPPGPQAAHQGNAEWATAVRSDSLHAALHFRQERTCFSTGGASRPTTPFTCMSFFCPTSPVEKHRKLKLSRLFLPHISPSLPPVPGPTPARPDLAVLVVGGASRDLHVTPWQRGDLRGGHVSKDCKWKTLTGGVGGGGLTESERERERDHSYILSLASNWGVMIRKACRGQHWST